ncbi:ADP-ribosylglycohydrolase [bacterium 336/3]|nr:ADP-ribosylglycohydrolase [bacterium 336/3]
MTTKKQLQDILLGIAIGDAYGAGIEFEDRDWLKANIDFSKFVMRRNDVIKVLNNKGIEVDNYNEWDYTDDTEMTIGCVKTIISGEGISEETLMKYWTLEYEQDKIEKGIGRHGHGSMRWVYNSEKSIEEIKDFQRNRPNPGNAPTMRAIPFGLLPSEQINEYATINAMATHPHPKAVASSILVARLTEFLIIKKRKKTDAYDYCKEHLKNIDQEFLKKFELVEQLPSPNMLQEPDYEILCGKQPIIKPWYPEGIKGLPSDAMQTALSIYYFVKHADTAFEGLKQAIWLGGDVDSVASVVTGILAGLYGIESLPNYMLENVEGRDKLIKLSQKWYEYLIK